MEHESPRLLTPVSVGCAFSQTRAAVLWCSGLALLLLIISATAGGWQVARG